jgi:type I restriction enzyme S subunit
VLSGWKIPIPPLEVQREIVRILDQFTKLEAELEAELEVRRRQYDHVRQELLTLSQGSGARFEKIGDLCTLVRGVELSLDDRKVGDYPLVTAGKTELARHNAFNYEKPSVTVTSHGAYAGFVNYWSNPIWLGNNVFLLEPKERVEVKFLFYSMKNQERLIQSRAKGGGVPYLNWKDIESIEIAVPRIETQRQIVKALDHFTELQRELESELISRRNQHRFYLDKLFEFPEATTP